MTLFSLRLPATAAAAVATLLVLTACTSSSHHHNASSSAVPTPSSSTASSTSALPTVTTTVTSPATPVTTPATATTTPAGTLACTNAQVVVTGTADPGGGAAGHSDVLLLFTNSSATPCTLYGYPGVAGLNSAGTQVGQATRTLTGYMGGCGCSTLPTVTLAPQAVASTIAEGDVGSGTNCSQFTALLVTPPNTTQSTRVAIAPYSCGFTVHPVVAGGTGRGA